MPAPVRITRRREDETTSMSFLRESGDGEECLGTKDVGGGDGGLAANSEAVELNRGQISVMRSSSGL